MITASHCASEGYGSYTFVPFALHLSLDSSTVTARRTDHLRAAGSTPFWCLETFSKNLSDPSFAHCAYSIVMTVCRTKVKQIRNVPTSSLFANGGNLTSGAGTTSSPALIAHCVSGLVHVWICCECVDILAKSQSCNALL